MDQKTYFLFRTNHESRFVCESMKGKKSSLWKILSFLTHTYIHWWALLKTDCCLFKDLSIICKSLQQYFCSHETSILSPVCIFIMTEFTFIYTFFACSNPLTERCSCQSTLSGPQIWYRRIALLLWHGRR